MFGTLCQFAFGQADGLVVDNPARAGGDEGSVDDVLRDNAVSDAAPRLFGTGTVEARRAWLWKRVLPYALYLKLIRRQQAKMQARMRRKAST